MKIHENEMKKSQSRCCLKQIWVENIIFDEKCQFYKREDFRMSPCIKSYIEPAPSTKPGNKATLLCQRLLCCQSPFFPEEPSIDV